MGAPPRESSARHRHVSAMDRVSQIQRAQSVPCTRRWWREQESAAPRSRELAQWTLDSRMGLHSIQRRSHNGRFLRNRFSPKPVSVATTNSLPKRNHVAKEAVSAAWHTRTRQRSESSLQTKRCSKDEAAALRKNHVIRHALGGACVSPWC